MSSYLWVRSKTTNENTASHKVKSSPGPDNVVSVLSNRARYSPRSESPLWPKDKKVVNDERTTHSVVANRSHHSTSENIDSGRLAELAKVGDAIAKEDVLTFSKKVVEPKGEVEKSVLLSSTDDGPAPMGAQHEAPRRTCKDR